MIYLTQTKPRHVHVLACHLSLREIIYLRVWLSLVFTGNCIYVSYLTFHEVKVNVPVWLYIVIAGKLNVRD